MFRYVVLGLLRSGTGLHGYALMKRYRQRTGLSINTGSFYRELQRLVTERLIASAMRGADADPRRAPYVITEAGMAAFDEWFAAPIPAGSTSSGEDQLAARLLFLAEAPPEVAHAVLATWQDALWARAKTLDHARDTALADPDARHGFDVLPHLLARRLRHIAADIELIDELRRTYDAWIATPAWDADDEVDPATIDPPLRHRLA
jgi:DNA-binding PadR family transcriptional regulator